MMMVVVLVVLVVVLVLVLVKFINITSIKHHHNHAHHHARHSPERIDSFCCSDKVSALSQRLSPLNFMLWITERRLGSRHRPARAAAPALPLQPRRR
jgi:hypothetical protein